VGRALTKARPARGPAAPKGPFFWPADLRKGLAVEHGLGSDESLPALQRPDRSRSPGTPARHNDGLEMTPEEGGDWPRSKPTATKDCGDRWKVEIKKPTVQGGHRTGWSRTPDPSRLAGGAGVGSLTDNDPRVARSHIWRTCAVL
jgi:hypothetical protein